MDPNTDPTHKPENGESEEDMHKTSPYVRTVVALHNLRDRTKEAVESLNEKGLAERVSESWEKTQTVVTQKTRKFFSHPENIQLEHIPNKYGYVFRPKSCWELILLGGTVCGIEFCYSAETAFVTPILLSLGLNIKFVTMIWCLSPLIGLTLTPILGSMSDSCESRMGRRRPFILLYSVGIIVGLVLVPNGHNIGLALGDTYNVNSNIPSSGSDSSMAQNDISSFNETHVILSNLEGLQPTELEKLLYTHSPEYEASINASNLFNISKSDVSISTEFESVENQTKPSSEISDENSAEKIRRKRSLDEDLDTENQEVIKARNAPTGHVQPWSIAFTVLGTMLLDFCSDACQSPSRTYLLDVSLPDDHAAGLSTFTLMAGLGGSLGYVMGAIHWEDTVLGRFLGGQVNVVFSIVTIVFIICLISTLCSFPEIPLTILRDPKMLNEYQEKLQIGSQPDVNEMDVLEIKSPPTYGATEENDGFKNIVEDDNTLAKALENQPKPPLVRTTSRRLSVSSIHAIDLPCNLKSAGEHPGLKDFLKSLFRMPKSLKILCLTNLFCWMSLVCYSLYFTDFVAECVFGGDPQAPEGSESYLLYKEGVQFGCWGMALYSLSCAVYSFFIEVLIKKFGAKATYVGGQMVYSIGMVVMAITRHKIAVILLSPTAGVMYSTLFTMPYLLIAHYHSTNTFSNEKKGCVGGVRGIGTDVAAVSSMVFLSQFVLSILMGSIVEAVGSNVATVCTAALLSFCGAISATQVLYLDI
ncbi:membrane-associated transporter protein [Trichonephila clavata]|uniref:Membrane-associated transporter protein n=1 Tax=Trichonephila clavata TaxID=2740835 RepID=A0A8X6JEI8_TRICU|nr:membrane-associated transporter protein [Trichonephila clavata]